MDPEGSRHILFYDGVCGLCDRLVQFLLARDRRCRFRFAALQSEFARTRLAAYGRDTSRLDTVYVLADAGTPAERLLHKSRAVLFAVHELGGAWRLLWALRVIPAPISDVLYNLVARVRYRLFGRLDTCRLPSPEERTRFIATE